MLLFLSLSISSLTLSCNRCSFALLYVRSFVLSFVCIVLMLMMNRRLDVFLFNNTHTHTHWIDTRIYMYIYIIMRGTARTSEQERKLFASARERERESLQQTYSRKKRSFCLFFEIYVLEKLCPILRRWATTRNYIIWWWQYNNRSRLSPNSSSNSL